MGGYFQNFHSRQCCCFAPGLARTRAVLDSYSTRARPVLDPYSTRTRPVLDPYSTCPRPVLDPPSGSYAGTGLLMLLVTGSLNQESGRTATKRTLSLSLSISFSLSLSFSHRSLLAYVRHLHQQYYYYNTTNTSLLLYYYYDYY